RQFLEQNVHIKREVESVLRDPLMNRLARASYRKQKLERLQELIRAEDSVVEEQLLAKLVEAFDTRRAAEGLPLRLKLRSSTNAEDLANFNGAGLYSSESYKPEKKGKELERAEKIAELKRALKVVWASIWNLRAYEEREYFKIPHDQVMMGVQVNPSFR